jgi:hypothetical protein
MLATTLVRKTRIFFVQLWITPDEQQSIIEFVVAHRIRDEWKESKENIGLSCLRQEGLPLHAQVETASI